MFTRRNHSRRNKQSFRTTGAEVLEERRMPSALTGLGNGGGILNDGGTLNARAGGGIENNARTPLYYILPYIEQDNIH